MQEWLYAVLPAHTVSSCYGALGTRQEQHGWLQQDFMWHGQIWDTGLSFFYGTTWGGPVAKSQKTLVLCRPRRRSPCPRSAIRACFSTGGTSRGLGGVPKVQRSRDWMGALDACAHRAASDAQMAARMANGARDNVCAMFIPLLHDDSMRAQCARNILLPRRPRARRLAD